MTAITNLTDQVHRAEIRGDAIVHLADTLSASHQDRQPAATVDQSTQTTPTQTAHPTVTTDRAVQVSGRALPLPPPSPRPPTSSPLPPADSNSPISPPLPGAVLLTRPELLIYSIEWSTTEFNVSSSAVHCLPVGNVLRMSNCVVINVYVTHRKQYHRLLLSNLPPFNGIILCSRVFNVLGIFL